MRRAAEPVAIGLATLAILTAYACLACFGIDLIDEGYFLDLASRVQHGQLPYRDFDTYYTPGLFYLEAAALTLLGPNVLTPRVLMLGFRLACAVLVYTVARRIAPPAFAATAALLQAGMGVLVSSSPGLPALFATLLMLEALVRHERKGAPRWWLVVAGATAALAFAFKQNVGAFALLGAAGYVLLRDRPGAGGLVFGVRLAYAVGLAWTITSFLDPALDEWLAAAVWLPLVLTLGLLLLWAGRPHDRAGLWTGFGPMAMDAAWLGTGFGLVTLVWLVPLVLVLGASNTPFDLFLGSVKRDALLFRLEALRHPAAGVALAGVWTPLAIAFVCGPRRARLVRSVGIAAQLSLVIAWLPTRAIPSEAMAAVTDPRPVLRMLIELDSLYLYLPGLAAWTGLLLLALRRRTHAQQPPVAWILLVGALAELAFYPRSDPPHGVLAGAPLLIVGAWVLARIHAALAGGANRLGQAAVFATLLVVPTAAVAPHAYARYSLLSPALRGEFVPVRLERASVLELRPYARALEGTIDFLQARTSPGEPVFAYPVDPLVNFLADRPNPTRFDHLMPGALSAAEMQEAVGSLEAAQPRFVFWDHGAVAFWDTDKPNRPLSDYIWRCYNQVAAFDPYLVLERAAACQTST